VVPHRREEPASYPAGRDRQKTRPLAGPRRSPDSRLQSGYALLSSRIRRHFLILIDARFSSRLSRSSSERALVAALAEMYVQGVSTRKVKAITEELCGHSFSASSISAMNQRLDASLAQFAGRPLAEAFPYLILDATRAMSGCARPA
jgi:hypothetical protein